MAVKLLILVSQFANVLAGGNEDEMLSSRAWRERNSSTVWASICWYLDNASPLMWWRGNYSSHCEACYWAERQRVMERVKDYESV